MLRRGLHFTGTVPASDAGKVVEIERRGQQTGNAGRPPPTARSPPTAPSRAYWRANHIGQFRGPGGAPGPRRACARAGAVADGHRRSSTARRARRWYGPGFYGKRTACGVNADPQHDRPRRTARCAAASTRRGLLRGHARSSVPVIDRGPYANDADWDLTMATGRALGIARHRADRSRLAAAGARVARLSAAGPPHWPRRRRLDAGLGPAVQRAAQPAVRRVHADALGRRGQPGLLGASISSLAVRAVLAEHGHADAHGQRRPAPRLRHSDRAAPCARPAPARRARPCPAR